MANNPITSLPWPAPAKINLFLHILGRREDGYHDLQTVFQLLDYADELTFAPRPDGRINVQANYDLPAPEQDLVFRAASLLQRRAGVQEGVTISVCKRIPMGGGLGGGSSDAATTLHALNEIWGAGLSAAELIETGLQLGADVPVFLYGHSAWAEGVGEKLQSLELPGDWYLVIHPGCKVATAEVFNAPDLTRNTLPITIRDFAAGAGHNDCEAVVFRSFPEIARAAAWLGRWTRPRLTGTGACLFGQFAGREAATGVLEQLPQEWRGFVSQGRNISPLMERLHLARQESG